MFLIKFQIGLVYHYVDKYDIYRFIESPFISFARPKETKQRKRRLIRGIFSTIKSKKRNQNSASLRAYAPALGAFDYYSGDKEFLKKQISIVF